MPHVLTLYRHYPRVCIGGLITVIIAIFATTLYYMGQPAWCACGLKLGTLDAWGNESSQNFIDPYTTSHILHGILFYAALVVIARKLALQWRLLLAIGIEIGWELLENSPIVINRYRSATASLGYTGDTILNSTSDVLFMMFGFWLAAKLPWKWTLAIVIAVELLMLAAYRDNLTLNVLMLLYPVATIKTWQMGH
jgi:Protein of unknown function (DUF2585)